MTKFWIKLYHEVLDDPKMGRLPDWLWRRAIELFLLAGENGDSGELRPVAEMAWRLRVSEEDLVKSLRALSQIGVVHESQPESNQWTVTHFMDRQDRDTTLERKRNQRKRSRKGDNIGHANVTLSDTDIDTESDIDIDKEDERPPNSFSIYESNIGPLTPMIAEKLKSAENDYSALWVEAALEEAVRHEGRNMGYIEAILKRWKRDGFQSSNKPKRNGNGHAPPGTSDVDMLKIIRESMK